MSVVVFFFKEKNGNRKQPLLRGLGGGEKKRSDPLPGNNIRENNRSYSRGFQGKFKKIKKEGGGGGRSHTRICIISASPARGVRWGAPWGGGGPGPGRGARKFGNQGGCLFKQFAGPRERGWTREPAFALKKKNLHDAKITLRRAAALTR